MKSPRRFKIMAYRKEKLEELIKRKVGDFLMKEIKDPRIGFVSITKVDLSKDNSYAKIGVSVLGSNKEIRKSMEGLRSAAGYIQHYLGRELNIRTVPKIEFKLDVSLTESARMTGLIEELMDGQDKEADSVLEEPNAT